MLPNFFPLQSRDVANLFVLSEEYLKQSGYYLPITYKMNPIFYIENSALFVKNENIKDFPEHYSIPLILGAAFLHMKNFTYLNDVFDHQWIIRTAFSLMPENIIEKCLFLKDNIPGIDALLNKDQGIYILPKTVLPELIDYAKKSTRTIRGDANKFAKRTYLYDPVKLGIEILENFELRKCKVCKKPCNDLVLTGCCEKVIHIGCAKNIKCPRGCTNDIVLLKKASSWKEVYVRTAHYDKNELFEIPKNSDKNIQNPNEEDKKRNKGNENIDNEGIFFFN